METARNYSLAGEPDMLSSDDLKHWIAGYVEAPEGFGPLLRSTFSSVSTQERVIFELETKPHFRCREVRASVGLGRPTPVISGDLAWTWRGSGSHGVAPPDWQPAAMYGERLQTVDSSPWHAPASWANDTKTSAW